MEFPTQLSEWIAIEIVSCRRAHKIIACRAILLHSSAWNLNYNAAFAFYD